MEIEFKQLREVSASAIIELMNHRLVRRQMPLFTHDFDESACAEFVQSKENLWTQYGYGPWAIFFDGQFGGWGGLQPENGEPDLALVLHPSYWGCGRAIFDMIVDRAFNKMNFESFTVLLPPTRKALRLLNKLGFSADGGLEIDGEPFTRYRLNRK